MDVKTQAESNISGQNGKKALDKNILGAIQCKLSTLVLLNRDYLWYDNYPQSLQHCDFWPGLIDVQSRQVLSQGHPGVLRMATF